MEVCPTPVADARRDSQMVPSQFRSMRRGGTARATVNCHFLPLPSSSPLGPLSLSLSLSLPQPHSRRPHCLPFRCPACTNRQSLSALAWPGWPLRYLVRQPVFLRPQFLPNRILNPMPPISHQTAIHFPITAPDSVTMHLVPRHPMASGRKQTQSQTSPTLPGGPRVTHVQSVCLTEHTFPPPFRLHAHRRPPTPAPEIWAGSAATIKSRYGATLRHHPDAYAALFGW